MYSEQSWVAYARGLPRLPRSSAPAIARGHPSRSSGAGPNLSLEALLEALDLTGRVHDRLLAREERVAVAADVDAQLLARAADGEFGAARTAMDAGLAVLGMNIGFHDVLLRRRPFGVEVPRRWPS